MRTTLDLEDDVIFAAREMAEDAEVTAGKMVSDLLRRAITAARATEQISDAPFFGFRPLPKGGHIVTNAHIDRLRDEEGI